MFLCVVDCKALAAAECVSSSGTRILKLVSELEAVSYPSSVKGETPGMRKGGYDGR